jgi:protein Lines
MVLKNNSEPNRVNKLPLITMNNNNNNNTTAHEQPVIKRQRIDNQQLSSDDDGGGGGSSSSSNEHKDHHEDSLSSSSESLSPSTSLIQQTGDNVDGTSLLSSALIERSLLATTTIITQTTIIKSEDEMELFQSSLTKQCLCGLSDKVLKKTFYNYYLNDLQHQLHEDLLGESGGGGGGSNNKVSKHLVIHNCSNNESSSNNPIILTNSNNTFSSNHNRHKLTQSMKIWPIRKQYEFLSNIQLMFDTYLKQNSKGTICSRLMELCDYIIRNEYNIIDDIFDITFNNDSNLNNKYTNFLSGRVISSFLIIIKDDVENKYLKKIVDNLFIFDDNNLDLMAIRKINFSLDIIKRIIEWKDIDEHPLDDEEEDIGLDGNHMPMLPPPPIENNYFAQNFGSQFLNNSSTHQPSSSRQPNQMNSYPQPGGGGHNPYTSRIADLFNGGPSPSTSSSSGHGSANSSTNSSNDNIPQQTCQIVTLTDSESFDTTHIKCITIKILENKWPALVKNISMLITSHRQLDYAENCIITFLVLWESIISVKANLSIVETLPFYSQLVRFELLLATNNLSCIIYKQMLSLFNEALCYGSTLALQDLLPEETCSLAHQIVRHVKDFRILESLPRNNSDHSISLLGTQGVTVEYEANSFEQSQPGTHHHLDQQRTTNLNFDKTLLQKMTLLVLKSVAVTVKEIRSDSSDSSIDSTDYDAYQDMMVIERSIRDVLKKLESFMKNTLEFHPESHFSRILIHLFDDQDDYLIEAMVCTLDVTTGISFRNNAFPELVAMLNPVYTFLEFLKMISNSPDLLLDLLVSNETCFLLYLLRFLKYIRINWSMFVQSCQNFGLGHNTLDDAMSVLIRLRLQISRLVAKSLYPYDIAPILRLLESCESLYEGNELS